MIIGGVGRSTAPRPAGATRTASGAFTVPSTPDSIGRPAPAAASLPLDAVLALQEQEAAAARERQARQHGHALLHALVALQQALLADSDAPAPLQHLAALANACPMATDPALAALLQALTLRARVELARRGL